jgi:Raf kinase inhibitor-like YbhB/YbcL family protein
MCKSAKAILFFLCALALISSASLEAIRRRRSQAYKAIDTNFMLLSSAFPNNGTIPSMYTCEGDDISPPLRWKNPPPGTQSFALIVEDPDSRGGHWANWVVFNLPGDMRQLSKGVNVAYYEGIEGVNSWKTNNWGGPCPPIKKHRYIFTIYALKSKRLRLSKKATRSELLRAMHGKVLAKARLVGTYQKKLKKEAVLI